MAPLVAASMGEVASVSAQSALFAGRHVGAGNTRRRRLPPNHLPQVERLRAGGTRQVQRREHLRADFVASSADRRARVDRQEGRVASEGVGHGGNPGFDHAAGDAPPAGVKERHGATDRVDHEDGNAVGQGHGQECSGGARRMSVGVAGKDVPMGDGVVHANLGPVDLATAHHGAPRRTDPQRKNALRRNSSSRPLAGGTQIDDPRRTCNRLRREPTSRLGLADRRRPLRRPGPQPGERRAPSRHWRRSRQHARRRRGRVAPVRHARPVHCANPLHRQVG